jgi:hypothetical protein
MAGALLRSGGLKSFQPLGAVGNPVYRAASQLRAAVRRHLGPEIAAMFAIPRQNDQGDRIDWYAPVEGDVVPWSAASADERADAKAALLDARRTLAAKSTEMQADARAERQVFGKLLAQATQIPSDEHVYLVDGRPVMTFWGFHPLDADASLDVIADLDTGAAEPTVAAPAPHAAPIPPAPDERAAAPRRRPWWWWLLAALALLLLLLLLLFALRQCGLDVPGLPPAPLVGEEEPVEDAVEPLPPEADVALPPVVVDRETRRAIVVDRDRVAVGDGRDVVVDDGVADRALDPGDALPGDAATDGQGPADVPPEVPVTEPPPAKELAGDEPAAGQEPPGEPPADEPSPDTPVPEMPQSEPTQPEPPQPEVPPSEPPQPEMPQPDAAAEGSGAAEPQGAPLVIPPEAAADGSTGFLQGEWRSVTGLQDRQGNPIHVDYDFQDGQGTVSLRRSVGSGSQVCSGAAEPRMQDGRLVIAQDRIRCPDGTTFQGSTVECTMGGDGRADCRGRNADGTDYDVNIVK